MIGTQIIQEYPGEYTRCVVERDYSEDKKKMFNTMSGNIVEIHSPEVYNVQFVNNYPNSIYRETDQEPLIRGRKIYVPLNPWFMNNNKCPYHWLHYNTTKLQLK